MPQEEVLDNPAYGGSESPEEEAAEAVAEVPLEEAPTNDPPEKYSAQFLRRLHQDHMILLEDYHELRQHLEHEDINAFAQRKLEDIADTLDEIETLFNTHHPEAKRLDGAFEEDEGVIPGDSTPRERVSEEDAYEGTMGEPGMEGADGESVAEEVLAEDEEEPLEEEPVEDEEVIEEEPVEEEFSEDEMEHQGKGWSEEALQYQAFRDAKRRHELKVDAIRKRRAHHERVGPKPMGTATRPVDLDEGSGYKPGDVLQDDSGNVTHKIEAFYGQDPRKGPTLRAVPVETVKSLKNGKKKVIQSCSECGEKPCQCNLEDAVGSTADGAYGNSLIASVDRAKVKEAASFLGEVGTIGTEDRTGFPDGDVPMFGPDHQKKAFFHAKQLEGMVPNMAGMAGGMGGGSDDAMGDTGEKKISESPRPHPRGGYEQNPSDGASLTTQQRTRSGPLDDWNVRELNAPSDESPSGTVTITLQSGSDEEKSLRGAVKFLTFLSGMKAVNFNDRMREECKFWHKELDGLAEDDEDGDAPKDENGEEDEEDEEGGDDAAQRRRPPDRDAGDVETKDHVGAEEKTVPPTPSGAGSTRGLSRAAARNWDRHLAETQPELSPAERMKIVRQKVRAGEVAPDLPPEPGEVGTKDDMEAEEKAVRVPPGRPGASRQMSQEAGSNGRAGKRKTRLEGQVQKTATTGQKAIPPQDTPRGWGSVDADDAIDPEDIIELADVPEEELTPAVESTRSKKRKTSKTIQEEKSLAENLALESKGIDALEKRMNEILARIG